jgi:hypothetical protein
VVTLLADKIINGERQPMYTLEFQFDEDRGTLSSEFRRGNAHGIWEYTLTGDNMVGRLVVLPEKSIGRSVKVSRVRENQVPTAPDRKLYG